jgi:DNA-binding IclR family transcriptional regulator
LDFMSEMRTVARSDAERYAVPALEKGLDVLEVLSGSHSGMTLKDIAAALGRTSPEIFRVLRCLLARGYLLRDDSQRLRVSTKLFELGCRHSSTQALVRHAQPHMERLAADTGVSCQLLIPVQDYLLVIAEAEAPVTLRFSQRVGAQIDLFESVGGLVALAYQTEERRRELERQYQERPAGRKDALAVGDARSWSDRLHQVRKQGYAVEDSPTICGSRVYGAPVFGAGGTLLAVLLLCRLSRVGERRPQDQRYLGPLLACASAIAGEFGPLADL